MPDYDHRHIDFSALAQSNEFKSPGSNARQRPLNRIRDDHGQRLIRELGAAFAAADRVRREPIIADADIEPADGIYLEVELALSTGPTTLERTREGTRQGAVTLTEQGARRVLLYVPDASREVFNSVFDDYTNTDIADDESPPKKSRVEPIEHIREARLRTFWRDDPAALPDDPQAVMWWALWCVPDRLDRVLDLAGQLELSVAPTDAQLRFPEVTVVPVYGRRAAIEMLLFSTGGVSELRRATDTPVVFTRDLADDVPAFVDDLAARITWPGGDVASVCLLDTGVNRGHSLIEPALAPADLHAINARWGMDDHSHNGHGTGMAGLALHGDLVAPLADNAERILSHRLESVKILPPDGFAPNDPYSYGAITKSAVALPEITAPNRPRLFCMAITNGNRSGAEATSWSAALDQISSGADAVDDEATPPRRLMIQAIGNIPDHADPEQIADLDAFPGEDPAQAWNVVSVGGTTFKSDVTDPGYEDWAAVAEVGAQSPYSRTSTLWQTNQSPVKPEIVFEAGNRAISPAGNEVLSGLDSLSLLTTSKSMAENPVTSFWATSAATAQAARQSAQIMAAYPDYWPETVRALMIHSAQWTPNMQAEIDTTAALGYHKTLARRFGYGMPDLGRALASARSDLALVAEKEIQPFRVENGSVRFNEAHSYQLPWPRALLEELENTRIKLKVTLSYFVEPNPSFSSAMDPARYQSFGLRFDLKRSRETDGNFQRRLNKEMRREDDPRHRNEDNDGWVFGPKAISSGSLHVDIWEGSAVELAARDRLYIFPISGWWRERRALGRANSKARYSLVLSLETPGVDTDLYTPVSASVDALIAAAVDVEVNN